MGKQGSINADAVASSVMTADPQDLSAHRQVMTVKDSTPPNAYCNAISSTWAGPPVFDEDPVLRSSSFCVVTAGAPVIKKTKVVSEVTLGLGITLPYLCLDDYKFITSLRVIGETEDQPGN